MFIDLIVGCIGAVGVWKMDGLFCLLFVIMNHMTW
jgi:hypothetical protein